jgi:trigger factor
MVLNSPLNPTGTVIDSEVLRGIATAIVEENNRRGDEPPCMLLYDQVYWMLDSEAQQIAHQLWHEENPEVEGHNHEKIEPTEERITLATRRVRLGLLLAEVGQKQEIQVSDQELQQAVFRQAQQYPGQEKAFFDFIQSNQQALQQIRAPLFEDKVVDHILEQAKIEEKTVTKDELQKAIEDMDEE